MMILFDYFYYRIAKAFLKRDGYTAARAISSLSALQCLLVLSIELICLKPFFPREVTAPYSKLFGYAGAAITIVFAVYNFIRYGYDGVKYTALATRWQDETRQQRRWRGMAVFLAVPLALAFNVILIIVSQ